MSKNAYRMIGIIAMIICVFLLIGGLYLPQANVSEIATNLCIVLGLMFLVLGIVFYKIIKWD